MRVCIATLIALLLSLNTAYAAVVGVSDAIEHTQSHAVDFGHHGHEADHDAPLVDPDGTGNAPFSEDNHHHAHVHPSFFAMPSCASGIAPVCNRPSRVAVPVRFFISAPQDRIERPPRAVLV